VALTKVDIVEALYEKVGFSKRESIDLVELIFDTLKSALSKEEKVKISGFGNFVVREKKSRMGRNPQTGESMRLAARRVLTFKPSQVLRMEVNGSLEGKPMKLDPVEEDDS
jgi:integration host factor subunit alpha